MWKVQVRLKAFRLDKLGKAWSFFLPYVVESWKPMGAALVCGLGAVVMQLLRPWPIKIVFDGILITQPNGAVQPWLAEARQLPTGLLLGGTCVALLLISVLWGLLSYGQTYLTARAGHSVVYALRYRVHAHLQRLSLRFHQQQRKGDLVMRMTGDINLLRDLLVDALVMGASAALMLVTMVTVLVVMDWRLSLVVLGLLPMLAMTNFKFSSRIRTAARRQRKNEGRIAAVVDEMLQGIRVIQAFGKEGAQDKRFRGSNRRGLKAGMKTLRLQASMSRVIEILLAAGTAAVFWYGVHRVQAGHLTAGDLLVFVSYVHSSFRPIRRLSRVSTRVAKALACAERISDLLGQEPEVLDQPNAKRAKRIRGAIDFRRVSFKYSGRRALNRVTFSIQAGSFVGLVGPSGAGKSTLLALMIRLFEPARGKIRLDRRELTCYKIESLRDQFSIVLQEPFLFGGTVRDNIAFRRDEVTDLEIVRAAQQADALEFIRELPEGFDTNIAEAGASLSAGQRQRITIARAYLRQAPILLLDEPTTGLDAGAEEKVLTALRRLMAGRTTVMVAHKLATVHDADQILVLDRGRLIEQGRHDELLAANGWYARTWQAQLEPAQPQVLTFEAPSPVTVGAES